LATSDIVNGIYRGAISPSQQTTTSSQGSSTELGLIP